MDEWGGGAQGEEHEPPPQRFLTCHHRPDPTTTGMETVNLHRICEFTNEVFDVNRTNRRDDFFSAMMRINPSVPFVSDRMYRGPREGYQYKVVRDLEGCGNEAISGIASLLVLPKKGENSLTCKFAAQCFRAMRDKKCGGTSKTLSLLCCFWHLHTPTSRSVDV